MSEWGLEKLRSRDHNLTRVSMGLQGEQSPELVQCEVLLTALVITLVMIRLRLVEGEDAIK